MSDSRVYRIDARGIEIEVEEAGASDRPLVLVHGYTGSRDDFLEVIPPLAELGRTIAIDQRGHGGSSNSGREAEYLLDELAADLSAVLQALELPPCDLLGHSMGGMVVLRLALAHPEQLRSLILMDTLARPFRFVPPQVIEGMRGFIEEKGMAGFYEMYRSSPRPRPPASLRCEEEMGSDRYWERIQTKLLAMDPAAYLGLGGQDFGGLLDRLHEIACPTTVIVGEQDVVFREPSTEIEAGIAGARQVVIPDAAHSPQHENPKAWLATVRDHLARARA